MNIKVNESISVLTKFNDDPFEVTPVKIKWKGRVYTITKIGFYHKEKRGRVLFHIFSVTTPTIFFRLAFDSEHLEWTLEEVSDGQVD